MVDITGKKSKPRVAKSKHVPGGAVEDAAVESAGVETAAVESSGVKEAAMKTGIVASLRGRIPSLQPAQAETLRDLFASPQYWALRDGGVLSFAPGKPGTPGATFMLEGEGVPLALDLDGTDNGYLDDGPHWSDYSGRSRMLAWSLAHESQLMRLSDGLGTALTPSEVSNDVPSDAPAEAADAAEHLWLDFIIDDADIEASTPARHRGKLRLPYAWLPRLLDRAEQAFDDDPLPTLGRWRQLPVAVAIQFARPGLRTAQWRALRPGDVIVVGTHSRSLRVWAHAAGWAWPLAGMSDGWRIDGAALSISHVHRESPAMNDNNASATAATSQIDEDAGARNLPVRVEFEIGTIEMSVGELSTLQPGYVFALPAHLEGANVIIRANGRAAGRGEVVAVGETLGVRLLSWS